MALFRSLPLLCLGILATCVSVRAAEPGGDDKAAVTTELISTHCRAGDIGFFRYTITNHSGEELSWDRIQRRAPSMMACANTLRKGCLPLLKFR
jgi:hypothetical protein